MPEKYYQNKVYPLQDEVLRGIQDLNVDFYLTGGTALSRCYLNHRYSDDLDLFVNDNPKFKDQ
jgi:predicted nucleotidyltransferase component of viral defense system